MKPKYPQIKYVLKPKSCVLCQVKRLFKKNNVPYADVIAFERELIGRGNRSMMPILKKWIDVRKES